MARMNNLFIGLFFAFCSSNGKSVTWAQTERNSKGGHLWQRLSFHIKKRENNQTAVIKPFSKASEDVTSESATDKMLYEVSESEERYPITYRPQTPSPISTVSQRTGEILARNQGADDEQIISVSSYVSQSSRTESGSCAGAAVSGGGGVASGAVGIVGVSSSSQGSLMEQISCVVNRFTANISELNSMMLSTSPPRSSKVPHPYFLSRDMSMPATMTTYAEIQPLPPVESNGGRAPASCPLGGPSAVKEKTLETPAPEPQALKSEMEEILTLTPPSPFRDSVASESVSNSPASGSSPKYECLVLRHYSQSSSSL